MLFSSRHRQICKELPRLPNDVTIIKIMKTFNEEIDYGARTKMFSVNKNNVVCTLYWLRMNHKGYRDIKINVKNLTWIDGKSGDLKSVVNEEYVADSFNDFEEDKGPAPKQIRNILKTNDHNSSFGIIEESNFGLPSKADLKPFKTLKKLGT